MKIILVGYPGSQQIVPASKYLTSKYLEGFDIKYLNYEGPIKEWAHYLSDYLSSLVDDYIIFSLDDYLISGPINIMQFELAKTYIENKFGIGCIKLCHSTFDEHEEYPITTQYCIWDRDFLIWLLVQNEINTPWEFEINGSKAFKKTKYESINIPCIEYDTHSSLSSRWEGVKLDGLNPKDIEDMDKLELFKQTGVLINDTIHNSKTVVFGGSGSLGHALIERLISMGRKNILSVSRNEASLVALKEKFPSIQIMVGDISDAWTVKSAMVDAVEVHVLSAMKHVGLAETSVNSCILTNVIGLMNIVNESLHTKPKVLMFISSDKAAQGNGVYGCSKKIGERLIAEAERMNPDTKYRVVRYGNVWGSNGSIITKWKPKLEKGEEVILTDPSASRFFWTMDEAVDLIFDCIHKAENSDPFIPVMRSVEMGVVLEACMEVYGKSPVKVIGLQPGENKVETTDGVIFSDTCEQFTKEEFKEKFLGVEKKYITKADPYKENDVSRELISCVLITKEKEYPKAVLERIDTGFFDEIIVITECPSIYHRYLAAKTAHNDIIYVQDDDCFVNYQVLWKHYNGQITNAMTKPFIDKYKNIGCSLVGWGCYFKKSKLSVFDMYISQYGVDNDLLREADRIFTYLNFPVNTIVMPHEDLNQTPDRMGYQPEHYKSMNEALEKAKSL